MTTIPSTVLEELAEWAVSAPQLDDSRRAHVNRMVLDNQCAAAAPSATEAGIVAHRIGTARRSTGTAPSGVATIIGGHAADLETAAYVNTMLSNALDYEPVGPEGHLLAAVVPTLLAAAECGGHATVDAVDAIAVGVEVGARVGLAIRRPAYRANQGRTPDVQGMSSVAIGTAAGLCRLWGCDAATTAHAMAMSTYAAPVPLMRRAFDAEVAPTSKYDPLGSHARAALESVELARAGAKGDLGAVDGAFGLWRVYGEAGFDTGAALHELGEHWYLDNEVWWKLFPVVLYSNPLIEAMALLATDSDLAGKPVDRVHMEHWNPKIGEKRTIPTTENDAWLSLPINGALAFLGATPRASWRTPAQYQRPDVLDLAARTTVVMVSQERSSRRGENGLWNGWAPWSVTVTAGGVQRRLEGDFLRRFSDEELEQKWRECLSAVSTDPVGTLAALKASLTGSARDLMAHLAGPGRAVTPRGGR